MRTSVKQLSIQARLTNDRLRCTTRRLFASYRDDDCISEIVAILLVTTALRDELKAIG